MAHPVIEQQRAYEGGGNMAQSAAPPETMGLTTELGEFSDKAVPNTLAALLLGAVGALVLMRVAGFRFSFGVNVGGGS